LSICLSASLKTSISSASSSTSRIVRMDLFTGKVLGKEGENIEISFTEKQQIPKKKPPV
jgi:hypothetical protein